MKFCPGCKLPINQFIQDQDDPTKQSFDCTCGMSWFKTAENSPEIISYHLKIDNWLISINLLNETTSFRYKPSYEARTFYSSEFKFDLAFTQDFIYKVPESLIELKQYLQTFLIFR